LFQKESEKVQITMALNNWKTIQVKEIEVQKEIAFFITQL
jgi:hypothetical protein